MPSIPHTRLFIGESRSVVVSGPHIQVIDRQTGQVLKSTANFDAVHKAAILKSGPIRCADVSEGFIHLVTSGEDKQLKVWQLADLQLLSERELPKKPTDAHFTGDGQTILVSDKFGDIFSYPLHPPVDATPAETPTEAPSADRRSQIVSHENPSGGTLILGHTSLLTSFLLTQDEKYLISADRDEHIRVSWYPQGYVIERFCLGHRKFVYSVHIPSFAPNILVSGGGDPMLKIWDWMGGEHLCDIPVGKVVQPFIVVRAPKGKWGSNEDDAGEERKGGKRRGKKGKGKQKAVKDDEDEQDDEGKVVSAEEVEEGRADNEDVQMGAAEATTNDAVVTTDELTQPGADDPLVLVIQRVSSAEVPSQGRFLIFSAIGATALFFCSFPSDFSDLLVDVEHVQLGSPIIDFTISDGGDVWALLDGERDEPSSDPRGHGGFKGLVQLLKWSESKLIVAENDDSPLLTSLNSICKVTATPEELKALDLYAALSAMPKYVDPDHDSFEGVGAQGTGQVRQGRRKRKADGELTQREQARMKKKQAVLERLQEQEQEKDNEGGGEEERLDKKAKAEETAEEGNDLGDTA